MGTTNAKIIGKGAGITPEMQTNVVNYLMARKEKDQDIQFVGLTYLMYEKYGGVWKCNKVCKHKGVYECAFVVASDYSICIDFGYWRICLWCSKLGTKAVPEPVDGSKKW